MRITPENELTRRYKALQQLMADQALDGVLMVQNSDLFYFTGSIQRGIYYLPVEGEPVYLVIKDFDRACRESHLSCIRKISSIRQLVDQITALGLAVPEKVGMELDVLPVQLFKRYQKLLPDAEITDISHLLRTVRAIKSDYELEIMASCANLADQTYEYAKTVIREGMSEIAVAAELECFARKEGHQGVIRFRSFNSELYFGHIFSGGTAAVPAYLDAPLGGPGLNPAVGQGAGNELIRVGEPIIIDFIIARDGYLVDQTRTLSIGPLSETLQRAYASMVMIQDKLCDIASPGVAWGNIYQQCCDLADDLGYRDNFMGFSGAQVSFIGHGIGIEVDEYPFIARGFDEAVLEENMTFAFEPKAVFPGIGVVGIENTWKVDADGISRITCADEDLVVL